jgi:hypothetical protein
MNMAGTVAKVALSLPIYVGLFMHSVLVKVKTDAQTPRSYFPSSEFEPLLCSGSTNITSL